MTFVEDPGVLFTSVGRTYDTTSVVRTIVLATTFTTFREQHPWSLMYGTCMLRFPSSWLYRPSFLQRCLSVL